ncbi:MAG: DUF2281 domain-containing protein [Bacteroidota bacterium]
MKAEELKIELISWIANLGKNEALNQLWKVKEEWDRRATNEKIAFSLRGSGLYEGKIKLVENFDEPLEDFKEYM